MAEKLYYSIKEVSELLQVPMPTLRYWEQEVRQLEPKTLRGRRYYTEDDIEMVRRLMFLRDQNVPVKEWSRRLTIDTRTVDKKRAAIDNLNAIKEELIILKNLI